MTNPRSERLVRADDLIDYVTAAELCGLQPDSFKKLHRRGGGGVLVPRMPEPVWEAVDGRRAGRLWSRQDVLLWASERGVRKHRTWNEE